MRVQLAAGAIRIPANGHQPRRVGPRSRALQPGVAQVRVPHQAVLQRGVLVRYQGAGRRVDRQLRVEGQVGGGAGQADARLERPQRKVLDGRVGDREDARRAVRRWLRRRLQRRTADHRRLRGAGGRARGRRGGGGGARVDDELVPRGGRFPCPVTVRSRRFPPLLVRGDRPYGAPALVARASLVRAPGCPRAAGYRVSGGGPLLLVRARRFFHAARQTRLVRLEVGRLARLRGGGGGGGGARASDHDPRRRFLPRLIRRLARLVVARTFVQRAQQAFVGRRVRSYLTASLGEERERALLRVQLQTKNDSYNSSFQLIPPRSS